LRPIWFIHNPFGLGAMPAISSFQVDSSESPLAGITSVSYDKPFLPNSSFAWTC
jgi:hypothetical protein